MSDGRVPFLSVIVKDGKVGVLWKKEGEANGINNLENDTHFMAKYLSKLITLGHMSWYYVLLVMLPEEVWRKKTF